MPTPTLAPLSSAERIALFDQVWQLVRDRYVYPDYNGNDWQAIREEFAPQVEAATKMDGFYDLLKAMIERLNDEHSRFVDPQDVALEEAEFEGNLTYVGIGVSVRKTADGGVITRIARGSPATEAGLQLRDIIVRVDGNLFTDETAFGPGGPISAVRGPPGTTVQLSIRDSTGTTRDIAVMRRAIANDAFEAVSAQRIVGTNTALLVINTFYLDDVENEVRDHLETLLAAGPMDGLIIDLRDNGGGRVGGMLNTLGLLVDGGSIGSTGSREQRNPLQVPKGEQLAGLADVPVVLLISGETASAAEMFSAGAQALGRARVVGTPSAGNTENLLPHQLPDGSRLWLAELTYRLPDDSLLEGRGVQPDRVVDAEWWRFPLESDPQILAALDELRR